jgi:hypothetical protein
MAIIEAEPYPFDLDLACSCILIIDSVTSSNRAEASRTDSLGREAAADDWSG